jgi:flagellar biosynthesis component FlhA
VATTAGAYTSTAIGDSIISSSSHLIIATGAGSIERLKFQTLVQQHLLNLQHLVMQFMVG